MVAWIIENGSIWTIASAKVWFDYCAKGLFSHWWFVLTVAISNMFLIESIVVLQWMWTQLLYHDQPVHCRKPPTTNVLKAICTIHIPVNVLAMAFVGTFDIGSYFSAPRLHPVDELLSHDMMWWLQTFACYRIVYDVAFYTYHRLLHQPAFFSWIHKTHHRHYDPDLTTNYQFTALDLFSEAMLTALSAQVVVSIMVTEMPLLAQAVFGTYVQWYQIGSHAPQRLPIVTAYPPLAPIYNHPMVKQWTRPKALQSHDAVRFHATHHRRVNGNYGITPWMDWLLGTTVKSVMPLVSEEERNARSDLAACHRLLAQFQMTDLFFTHLSLRIPGEDAFLVSPFGILFGHMTASALVKVTLEGEAMETTDATSASFRNDTAIHIHSAMQRAGHAAVVHTHTVAGNAVSCNHDGLLPLTQKAMLVLPFIARQSFHALALDASEGEAMSATLAKDSNLRVLLLEHHGLLTVGSTIGEAFLWMEWMEKACQMQVQISSMSAFSSPLTPTEESVQTTMDQARRFLAPHKPLAFDNQRYWNELLALLSSDDDWNA